MIARQARLFFNEANEQHVNRGFGIGVAAAYLAVRIATNSGYNPDLASTALTCGAGVALNTLVVLLTEGLRGVTLHKMAAANIAFLMGFGVSYAIADTLTYRPERLKPGR